MSNSLETVRDYRLGFETTKRLTVSNFELLLLIGDMNDENILMEAFDFPYKIIKGRLELINKSRKLIVEPNAIGAIIILADGVPGRLILCLIDILNSGIEHCRYVDVLGLYPNGFYNDGIFETIVDNHIKTRTLPNSQIY